MKSYKKFLAFVLSVLMIFVLCSCNLLPDNTDNPGGPGGNVVTPGGDDDSNKPGDDNPNKPGDDDPNKPGDDNPNKPGDDDPNKPGDDDPNKPGDDDSNRVADTRQITDQEYTVYNTTGVDDFGRTVLTVDGKTDSKKYVGLFYFLWLGQHTNGAKKIYDISKITDNGTNNNAFQVDNEDSPLGPYHHWGESAFGYYDSGDEWVIRKHIEMFVAAGIDFLIFDCTNGITYQSNAKKVLDILLEYQAAGWNVPKIMYYVAYPDSYLTILKDVYNFAYRDNTYESIWFAPEGKPMITMHQNWFYQGEEKFYGLNMNDSVEKAIFNRFHFKCRQWPNDPTGDEWEGVPWMEWKYPQPNHNGWMNVSIGQHLTVRFSDTEGTQGRGYNFETGKTNHKRYKEDLNFQGQWKTVLDDKDDVDYVFVTGWNEWIAMKMKSGNTYFTVDTFNAEYSRDIEPSENLGDNTYMLMSQKIREYNYSPAKHYIYPKTTIDISKDDAAWNNIRKYVDFTNDCKNRNYKSYMPTSKTYPNLTDKSGRNDISTIQVARDNNYLYFRVTVAGNAVTTPTAGDSKWMNIWLKTQNGTSTYNGYNYVLNRSVDGNKTTVQKAEDGKLVDCATGDLYLNGNVMIVRVALSDLGLSATNYDIEFKVTDNVKEAEIFNYLDYYRTGDAAPIGRLNYKYGY